MKGRYNIMLNGMRLKLRRTYLGLTLTEMAKKMYTTRQILSNIENGKPRSEGMELYYKLKLDRLFKERGVTLIIED